MTRTVAMIVAAVLALGAVSAGIAIAADIRGGSTATDNGQNGDDGARDDDGAGEGTESESSETLTGASAEQASAAALRVSGGGTVVQVEAGDDGSSGYEVEIRKSDGSVTEVELDGRFEAGPTETDDD